MSPSKTYNHHCSTCNEETPHVSVHPRPLQIALRTWQITVFFLSCAMLYPHTFSADDEFAVKCVKCGSHGTMAYG